MTLNILPTFEIPNKSQINLGSLFYQNINNNFATIVLCHNSDGMMVNTICARVEEEDGKLMMYLACSNSCLIKHIQSLAKAVSNKSDI